MYEQIKVLRQLIAAGLIDKDSSGTKYSSSKDVPYRASGITEDVFIHPSSIIAGSAPPEYIVFNEVVRTTRVWLKG